MKASSATTDRSSAGTVRSEDPVKENRRLRRAMRDLVALSTLPAIWGGMSRYGIAGSLCDVLLNTLSLDLVYVQMADRSRAGAVEVLRTKVPADTGREPAAREALAALAQSYAGGQPLRMPDPFGTTGFWHVAVIRFGIGTETGVLIACSGNSTFPTAEERLLLGVGANQTAIVIQRRIIEEQVREQREWLRVTLASIGDGVIATDIEGRVTFLNAVAEGLTGWAMTEAKGRLLSEVFSIVNEDDRRPVLNPVDRAQRDGGVSRLASRTVLLARGGKETPIDDSAAPILDSAGSTVGAVLVFRDVTEQRRAEENLRASEERKTAILQTALDSIITMDHLGSVVEFNPAAERTFGFSREEAVGRELCELIIPPRLRERHRQGLIRYLATGESAVLGRRVELPAVRADGSEMQVELSINRISSRGPPMFTAYIRDITERKQAEIALADARAQLDAALDAGAIATWCWDIPGNRLFANSTLARLFGLPPADAEGGSLEKYLRAIHPEDLPAVTSALDRSVRIGEAYEADYRIVQADGSMRWVTARGRPECDEAGRALRMPGVLVDITERKKLETELRLRADQLAEADKRKDELLDSLRASEERLQLLANTIPQLAWMAHPDGSIFWYNRGWYEYTGTTSEEMEGWGWQRVHDPAVLPVVLERWNHSLANGEPFEMVFPLRGADSAFRPFLTRVNPLRGEDGRILYWFGTNTDISEIKRMEDALRDADRRKDEFLATLAHELRNPLAPIRNSLEILKIPRVDPATFQQTREMMDRQVHHLVRLVDDLLDVSRVMRGRIELRREPVELATIVARAVETAQPLIDLRGHRLDIALSQESLLLHGDVVRLAQVVANLLTNSAKYTEPNGRIWLSASREQTDVVLRVKDSGIGIAPDMLPHVFELFVQADHAGTRGQGGLGIGLTVVKNLTEMHGGTVEARSAGLGAGSEFIVRLPLLVQHDVRHESARDDELPPGTPSIGHKILVVDDNKDAATSLAFLLRLQGHEVRVTHDGESALALAKSYRPEMIFLDLGMPGMDGYEVARRIRQQDGLQSVVLTALTGWGHQDDRRRTAAAGFDHHLVKPPELKALQNLLHSLSAAR